METNTKKGYIERDTLELVLDEFTQEKKINNKHIEALIIAVDTVDKKDTFKNEHNTVESVSESIGIKSLVMILQNDFLDKKYIIGR